jgi:hypothetical protein
VGIGETLLAFEHYDVLRADPRPNPG